MKKIMSLGHSPKAYIRVEPQWGKDDQIFVSMRANKETSPEYSVVLDVDGIKKLRKHLKKALEAIESVGEDEAEEEPNFPDWFQKGAIVEITGNSNEHEFAIGEKVRVGTELGDAGAAIRCDYLDGHDYWFVLPDDCKPA